MSNFNITLEPYKGKTTRFHCPRCKDARRTFTRYIDIENKMHIHETVGKCNREDSCGYHLKPKEYFAINHINSAVIYPRKIETPQTIKSTSLVPKELVNRSMTQYENNNFIQFIKRKFGEEVAVSICRKYQVGTSKRWSGANIFWQCDIDNNFRTGKIMIYNPDTCKRLVDSYKNTINWVHSSIDKDNFNLKQCLFGEHLIANNNNPIAVVESEKNAIIASIYYPNLIWLATGSKNNLSAERCEVLSGRKVTLFPDYGAYQDWRMKALEFGFEIDDFIEKYASTNKKTKGFDIADYLLSFSIPTKEDYLVSDIEESGRDDSTIIEKANIQIVEASRNSSKKSIYFIEIPKKENWNTEIAELEQFFASVKMPSFPIKLDQCTTISNVSEYVNRSLVVLKANNGKATFRAELLRLKKLKLLCEF